MIFAPIFYETKTCKWCGIECDHLVEFEEYSVKTHEVTYRVTCSECLNRAFLAKKKELKLYNYTRFSCHIRKWDSLAPDIFSPSVN